MIKLSYQIDGRTEYLTERAFTSRHEAEMYLFEQNIPAEDFRFINFEEVA